MDGVHMRTAFVRRIAFAGCECVDASHSFGKLPLTQRERGIKKVFAWCYSNSANWLSSRGLPFCQIGRLQAGGHILCGQITNCITDFNADSVFRVYIHITFHVPSGSQSSGRLQGYAYRYRCSVFKKGSIATGHLAHTMAFVSHTLCAERACFLSGDAIGYNKVTISHYMQSNSDRLITNFVTI